MKTLWRVLAFCAVWTCALHASNAQAVETVTVGSSRSTENAILGSALELLAESAGADAKHREKMGEPPELWQALLNGELDAYVDYTGALMRERFYLETEGLGIVEVFESLEQVEAKLAEFNVKMSASIFYSTDGNLQKEDAVVLYRADLEARAPKVAAAFLKLEGSITEAEMTAMSGETDRKFLPESSVADKFVKEKFPEIASVVGSAGGAGNSGVAGIDIEVEVDTWVTRLTKYTVDHLIMVGIALAAALLISIPLGIGAARNETFGKAVLGFVGILQTIPSLALLVLMIPLVGLGKDAAILALFFYSLLPIVQNTHAGLSGIQKGVIESASALGLTSWARLWLVELPIALRSILAGVKIAAVQLIGFATLGAFIGAGGYGQPILNGIRVNRIPLILEGAIPAALMALLAQGLFELVERSIVSKGLRIRAEE